MPAPSLALAQLLQSCASKRLLALGHHAPARAYASPFLHKQDAAEKIGLHVKPIEAAHFARRAEDAQRSWREPRNRAVRDIEHTRSLARRLARIPAFERLFLLMLGEFGRSPHVNAPRLGAFAAFARAGADELTLELGKPAKHSEHQPPVRGRRVRPCVAKRTEARALLGDLRQRVQEVACRTRETIKARHKQGVAVIKAAYRARQFGAFGLRPAGRLLENLLGSGGAKLLHLSVNALAVRRDSRVAVNHGFILHQTYATRKPLKINGLVL
jgi:hypothetical protein